MSQSRTLEYPLGLESTKESLSIKFTIPIETPLKEGQNFFWADEKTELIVIKKGKQLRAFPSICPHMGAQLQYHEDREVLACPWHELDFKLSNLKSSHHRYKKICEFTAEEKPNELVIYERGRS